ncbi:TPA: hypothetical protein ACF91S_004014 [Salmonella enterica subsp. enterica serovar Newport]
MSGIHPFPVRKRLRDRNPHRTGICDDDCSGDTLREQFDEPASASRPVAQLPRLAA